MIRLCLNFNKIEFEDIRCTAEQWAELKSSGKTIFNLLPAIEIEGKWYGQSFAILRLLSQRNGNYPTTPDEIYRCETASDFTDDCMAKFRPYWWTQDEAKKKEVYEAYFRDHLPGILKKIAQLLTENKENPTFVVGSKVTMADFVLMSFLSMMVFHKDRLEITKPALAGAPEVTAYWKARKADYGDYFETRPYTFL
jgi:glutathione S-transferase